MLLQSAYYTVQDFLVDHNVWNVTSIITGPRDIRIRYDILTSLGDERSAKMSMFKFVQIKILRDTVVMVKYVKLKKHREFKIEI